MTKNYILTGRNKRHFDTYQWRENTLYLSSILGTRSLSFNSSFFSTYLLKPLVKSYPYQSKPKSFTLKVWHPTVKRLQYLHLILSYIRLFLMFPFKLWFPTCMVAAVTDWEILKSDVKIHFVHTCTLVATNLWYNCRFFFNNLEMLVKTG